MKRLPMMLQLALILFGVMIIPTSLLTWYSGTQILGNSEKVIADSSLAGLESNRVLNENALSYIAQDTVRIASSKLFDRIRQYKTYEQLNASYNRVESALTLFKEIQGLIRSNDGVYSAYFYLSEADYIISSDKGVTLLERYEPIDWVDTALMKKDGIAGVWYPREMSNGQMVLSYVLPLNSLSTSAKGFLVVNLKESQIAKNISKQNNSYFLIDTNEKMFISHNDKNLLLKSTADIPFISQLLKQQPKKGYIFHEVDGERLLYTWSKSNSYQWMYVNVYSMDNLMMQTRAVQRNIIILTAAIILIGTIFTVLFSTWLSRPLRELVRNIRARGNLTFSNKNELEFLNTAFRRMQDEEDKLHVLIKEHEQDAYSLAIHHLFRGDALDKKKKELLQDIFPEKYFVIAILSIDQYSKYVNQTSPETRSYHRYLFISNYDSPLPQSPYIRSVYYGEGRMALVINFDEQVRHETIMHTAEGIRDSAVEVFGHTVTLGVSSITESTITIPEKLLEALELIKHRMIAGNGRIIFGKQEQHENKKYIYPTNSERRILNFLDTGDFEHILLELNSIRSQIESAEYISYDNILFIYNQLVGVTIKHINEKNINTSSIFANRGNIYSAIASMDTLDEIEGYLRQFFREISKHIERCSNEINYIEQISTYLDQHFCQDIIFEDMAKEIGISYSYMRKIFYEETGESLINYINYKRIQKAKQLLVETSLNVTQIATEVGYNNIQSFNRFFRKFEGVTASSYKSSKLSI